MIAAAPQILSSTNEVASSDSSSITKDTVEKSQVEKKVDEPVVAVPAKPKYATHEEAKAAFKELLREKVKGLLTYRARDRR